MADKVGEAEYELDMDTSQFKAKAEDAGSFLQRTMAVAAGIEFQRISEKFAQIGVELFNLVADFDHYIITLGSQGAIAQQTAQDIANAMLDMSRTTLFGASEIVVAVAGVAQRLETLTGREVNVADSTKFMAAATDLAVASSQDLATTTSTLINVMLAYNIPLEKVAEATDKVFNLSRITGVDFITLSLAADRLKARMGEAAPTLEDMGSVLAMVNELGITGSRGLLVLVSGVESLTSGSKEVNNELNRLGVGVYDAQGRFVGFRAVIEQLSAVYTKMTPQQRQLSADILFSSQASNILLGLIDKGTESFDQFNERITTTDTVATGANQHIADLNGQIVILKNNITATAIQLGNNLEPAVTKTLAVLNGILGVLTANEEVMLALAIVAGGVLVAGLLAVAAAFISVAGAATVAFIAANAALLGIPIAVAAAVAAIVLLVRNFEQVVDFVQNNWQALLVLISAPITGGVGISIAAMMLMKGEWDNLFLSLPGVVQQFIIAFAEQIDQMVGIFVEGVNKMIRKYNEIARFVGADVSELSGTDFSGSLEEQLERQRQEREEKQFFDEFLRGENAPVGPGTTGGGGTGPPVVPPFTADPAKAPKAIPQSVLDMRALAAAFAAWQELTGDTSIHNFRVYLGLQAAEIELRERESEALIALGISQIQATNQMYELRLAFVQMVEEAARSGRSLQEVIRDVFQGAADEAMSLLNDIMGGATRESTEMQLRIDRLRRQALLLERGGADSSRVDNAGKEGRPQPNAADRELRRIEQQIEMLELEQRIRQTNLDIMKSEATLKQQNLQTDRDIATANEFLKTVIYNLTGTVKTLDDALGGLIGRLTQQFGITQLQTGLPYVPTPMLALLHEGEGVLNARQNQEYRMGMMPSGPLAQFSMAFHGSDFDRMRTEMNEQYDQAVWQIRRRGSSTPRGSFSGR